MNHTTDISKGECVKRLNAAFDAVLDHERLSIHVRAHIMEALTEIQRSVKGWRADARYVRRSFARLKEFIMNYVPETYLSGLYERVESAADACRALMDELDDSSDVAVEGEQVNPRWKLSF
ncbi:hypothetical protein [Coraliomargarita parva]|uniref:hypothetical protein n=1 Tax=Coraliomargarita parva TaxID=3014050 RepID=UPI0022B56A7B|nr:hypothetical protein [Coraliomargarita parva]